MLYVCVVSLVVILYVQEDVTRLLSLCPPQRIPGRNGQVAQGNLQHMHQEPAFLLWMGLLIGRLLQIILQRR